MNKLSEKEKENALNEVRILASIEYLNQSIQNLILIYRHENVIAYKEAFFEEETLSLCIIMEFADNGDIESKISEFKKKGAFITENEIWNMFT
jgi:NIMA (never in mitosis gene a)-related kinase 1/4/5